ncbi:Cyclic nucleotide-binding domain [Popillia japonica]|uniref:Cyclic nucleotide-binding domain n=1 Tax=Popillia japonica TaxID=7064 RepID=A0AAW1LDH2_POPJA
MMQRVIQYFEFRFQQNYFKEDEILSTLSHKLIDEINIHSCESLIENVNILKNMPASVVLKMTTVMKKEVFLPNDVIILANTPGDCMFFISSGTVAVYTPSGKEICHLSDGGNFGEISLIMDHATRVATVVAIDYCDLFSLSRKDFRIAIEPYPELMQRTIKIAKLRMRNVMLAEHYRNRPDEYYDFSTPEGIADFIVKMHEL